MKLIYIAGPLSGKPSRGVRDAIAAADNVLALGGLPFIPHLTHFWDMISPKPYKQWIDYDREFIYRCDALLRLPGESTGADMEVRYAREWNIPVFHSLNEVEDYIKDAE